MIILGAIIIGTAVFLAKVFILQNYWKERGIRYVKPWPLFGYMAPNIFKRKPFVKIVQDVYNNFPEQRYFGCYQFATPVLMIRDPELIQRVMVENFDKFPQHKIYIHADKDPMWSKNLYSMKGGEEWQDMRSLLASMFTNNALKDMFGLIQACAKNVTEHYHRTDQQVEVDLKDLTSRFTNDVIASTAFGIDCNSVLKPDNEFYRTTQEVVNVSPIRLLKLFAHAICPPVAKFLNIRLFDPRYRRFYNNLVKQNIAERQQNGIVRPDMIQLLMEARQKHSSPNEAANNTTNSRKPEITDDDITAQATVFFFSGFDTVLSTATHLIYELALNNDVQQKLREEIDSVQEEITYERLLNLKYLDMVVSETLRKWPSSALNDRECITTFNIEPQLVWESRLEVEPNTLCAFPIFAIHRDPKLYPNPNKFDPERFNDINKQNIKPFTYLPFGAGPRNCIGSRFADLEIKVFVFHLIAAFEIVRTEKTKDEKIYNKLSVHLGSSDGFWVGLEPRRIVKL